MDMEKVAEGLCNAIGIIHGYVPKRYWGYGEQACRDAIALLKEQEDKDRMFHALKEDWKRLKEQETVVRCKDCKFMIEDNVYECGIRNFEVNEDWFCADGERFGNSEQL